MTTRQTTRGSGRRRVSAVCTSLWLAGLGFAASTTPATGAADRPTGHQESAPIGIDSVAIPDAQVPDALILDRVARWRAIEQASRRDGGAAPLAAQADELMADIDLERLSGRQIRAAAEILRSSPRLLDATRSLLAKRAEASGAEGYLARLDWFFVARHAPSGMAVGSSDDHVVFQRDLVELVRHPEFPAALLRGDAFHVAHALTRLQPDDRRPLAPAVMAAIRTDLAATPEGLHAATAAVATIAADGDAADSDAADSDADGLAEARSTLANRLDAMATDKAGSDWGEQLRRLSGLVRSPYLGRHPSERTPPDSLLTVAQGDGFLERRLRDFAGRVVVLVVANRPLGEWQTSALQALRAKFPSTDVTIIVLLPRGETEGAVARPSSGDYLVATCDPADWHDSSTGFSLVSMSDPRVFVLDTNTAIVDGDLGPSAGVREGAIVRALARPKFTPPGRGMDDTPALRPTSQP